MKIKNPGFNPIPWELWERIPLAQECLEFEVFFVSELIELLVSYVFA